MAGSENLNDHINGAGASNSENNQNRKMEMSKINKSNSGLRSVVESIVSKQPWTDFRSYKLTHFLKPHLTSNTKTLMITTASQEMRFFTASKISMEFAQSMKNVRITALKQK